MKYIFYGKDIDKVKELNNRNNVILFNGILSELTPYLPLNFAVVCPCTVKLEVIGEINGITDEIRNAVLDEYGYKSKAGNKFIPIGSAVYYMGFIFLPLMLNYNSYRILNYKYAMNALHRLGEKCDLFSIIVCPIFQYNKIVVRSFDVKLFGKDVSKYNNYYDVQFKYHNNQPVCYENLEFIFGNNRIITNEKKLVELIEDIVEEEGFSSSDSDVEYISSTSEDK